jgi:hypothetical protein
MSDKLRLEIDFQTPLALPLHLTEMGAGHVVQTAGALRLELPASSPTAYHDAQISDYTGRRDFRWRPPLRMEVRAWVIGASAPSEPLSGTTGFGFWSHPFVPGERGFRLPQTVWFFFSSPPSDIRLAQGVPGPGWKAATMDATRWPFLLLLPSAPLGLLLMRIPALYKRLWPLAQRAMGVSEMLLDAALLTEPHTYTLDWHEDRITFAVDGTAVHHTTTAPRGPLGFIAWVDNQYAIVTPQGRFGFGLVNIPQPQTLLLEYVRVQGL